MSAQTVSKTPIAYVINEIWTKQKKSCIAVAIALIGLAASQALFLLLSKGFLEALLLSSSDSISLQAIIPENIGKQLLPEISLSRADLFYLLPAAIMISGIIKSISTYYYTYGQQKITLRLANTLRSQLFSSIIGSDYINISKKSPGEWMSRIVNDIFLLQIRLSDSLSGLVKDSILVLTGIIFLSIIHWQSAAALIIAAPFIIKFLGRGGNRIAHYTEEFQKELSKISASVLDIRSRFDFLRVQQGEQLEFETFHEKNRNYLQLILKSLPIRAALAPGMEFMGVSIFALAIYTIYRGYWGQDINSSTLGLFFITLGMLLKPMRNIGDQMSRWFEINGAIKENLDMIHTKPSRDSTYSISETIQSPTAAIQLSSIVFGYDNVEARQPFTIAGKEIVLEQGTINLIVGPSGCGKSTIIKTLAGLIHPVDTNDPKTLNLISQNSSYVSQQPFFFKETIYKNLTYGLKTDVDEDAIWKALDYVDLQAFVDSIPNRLNTVIDPLDPNFSGGQLQRLCIARALLRPHQFLLLDEATSSLDFKTENLIMNRLQKHYTNSSNAILGITHKMHMLSLADSIWFTNGKILKTFNSLDSAKKSAEFCAFIQGME